MRFVRSTVLVRAVGLLCAALAMLCSERSAAAAKTSAAAKRIVVTQADVPTVKAAIAAHAGHVVVVNFWATFCIPCMEEFPALVKMQNRYRHAGVVVLAISADQAKDIPGKVKPFLARQHADFPQFLEKYKDPEEFINAFDPKWQGDLPQTFIYDRQGHLVKILKTPFTYQSLSAVIKPLLK